MPTKNIFLTIDDCTSINSKKRMEFLAQHKIPAVLFCRGEFIEQNLSILTDIINNYDFLIGNHSYSHPHFSEILTEECLNEITKTEILIEKCYQMANKKRQQKLIRFPFGDRGAGMLFKEGNTAKERNKIQTIQSFIKKLGFQSLNHLISDKTQKEFLDTAWDWDVFDYKTKMIESPELYYKNLKTSFELLDTDRTMLLIHDFEHNFHLFKTTLEFLISKKVTFLPYNL